MPVRAWPQVWFAVAPPDLGAPGSDGVKALVRAGLVGVEAMDQHLPKDLPVLEPNLFCAKGWSLSYTFDPSQATALALHGAIVEFHVFTEGTTKNDALSAATGRWNLRTSPRDLKVGQWYHVVVSYFSKRSRWAVLA